MTDISVEDYQAAENNSSRRKDLLTDKAVIVDKTTQWLATATVAHGEATLASDKQALLAMKQDLISELSAILV